MFKKLIAGVLTLGLTASMALPAMAAFEPDKDSALTKYYSFEDTIGDAKSLSKPDAATDLSDGGNVLFTEGVYGKSLLLDGTTGLQIGEDIVKGTKFTIAFWMNPEDITPWTAAFFGRKFDDGDPAKYWMSIAPRTDIDANPDRHLMFWTCGEEDYGYWFDGITSIAPELNKWLHIAVTVNEDEVVVYGDGQIIFDTRTTDANFTDNIYNFSDAWANGGATFYIGVNEFADAAFKGKVDEFYSFNRTLSQNEVVELMNYNPNAAGEETAAEVPADETAPAGETAPANDPAPVPASESSSATAAPQTGDNMAILFGIIAASALAGFVVTKKVIKN